MWWIILTIFLTLITTCILKDTHAKVYEYDTKCRIRVKEEYDFELPVWGLLLMIIVYLLPGINIVVFVLFLITFVYLSFHREPISYHDESVEYSLKGNNWLTKGLLAIKKLLNRKI